MPGLTIFLHRLVAAMSLRSLCLGAAALLALPAGAHAAGAVIGDSLGVGVSWASKLPSFAKNSIAIHGGQILEQIRQVPRGATAFMSLGTNDAVGGAVDVAKPVQDILAAAKAQDLRLVWIGPPCVYKPWDVSARKLDANLRAELAGTGVLYVGMRDADLCDDHSLRGAEGVHFNMAGYSLMWHKAAAAAGFPIVAAAADQTPPKAGAHAATARKKHRKKILPRASDAAPEVARGAG